MRFLCMVLSCVALRGLGSCGGAEYTAEVHVVSSDPREYDVSVTSTTYPVVTKDTKETPDYKPSHSPSHSSSFTTSSTPGTHNLPHRGSESPSSHEHAGAIQDSTVLQIVTSSKDRSTPCNIHGNSASCKVDSSLSPALHAQGSPLLPTASQEPPGAALGAREIRSNPGEINKNIFPGQMQRSGSVASPASVSQARQTQAGEHTRPRDSYANEGRTVNSLTGYTPARQVKTNQAGEEHKVVTGDKIEPLLMNQTVNLQNVSNNHFSIILQSPHHHAPASQLLDNYTRDFQRKLVNQSATIHPKLTNQTTSQQVPTSQMGTFQHTPTHQTADISFPELLQSAAIQQTAHEDPICEAGDTQQDQIEQSGTIQQAISQTPPSEVGVTSSMPNQTSTPQPALVSPPQATAPPPSPLHALQVPPNHTEATETLPTSPQITEPLTSPLEAQQAPQNPQQVTGGLTVSPQTTVAHTSTLEATQGQPNSPQTPQTPPEFKEASENQTDTLQRASVNQTQIFQENTLNQTNNVQVFANQTGTSPGNTSNLTDMTQIPSATGTGTPRSLEHARKSQPRRKRRRGRIFANVTKRSALKKVSKSCPCAGKVIQRMTTCKKPCTRNDDLLLKLFYVALVILVVYVLFLVYFHLWFRRWSL